MCGRGANVGAAVCRAAAIVDTTVDSADRLTPCRDVGVADTGRCATINRHIASSLSTRSALPGRPLTDALISSVVCSAVTLPAC